uniref:Uncharacterized protein n=1 Tax=Timema monikensis TaxID=170555 RepID=A0A7R9HSR7_9NEOP|nr:unnamed protein product [Timema monikensis]
MEENEPLTIYGSKTMKLASEIKYQAENLSDNTRMMRIISGLTPLNQNLETLWYNIRAGIDLNSLLARLRQEEDQQNKQSGLDSDTFSSRKGKHSSRLWTSNSKTKDTNSIEDRKKVINGRSCGQVEHWQLDCPKKENKTSVAFLVLSSEITNGAFTDVWIIELSALQHMTSRKNLGPNLFSTGTVTSQSSMMVERERVCDLQYLDETIAVIGVKGSANQYGLGLHWDNEMTESEDHTSDERAHYETSNDSDTSIQHIGESISESDMDFQPSFLDKLDNFIQTFKRKTDANVRNIKDDYDLKDNELNSSIIPTITTKRKPLENIVEVEEKLIPVLSQNSLIVVDNTPYNTVQINKPPPMGSRKAEMQLWLDTNSIACGEQMKKKSPPPIKKPVSMVKNEDTIHIIEQEKVLLASMDSSALPKPLIKLQMLSAENEAKQYQIRQVLIDLDSAHKRIEELQNTIQIKEKFIDDLIKNSNMRATAKERCQRKSSKLEEEYNKTRTNLAQAENALLLNVNDSYPDKEKLKHKQEIEKYKKITVHYEKRLKDIEFIKQIAGDSAKKVTGRDRLASNLEPLLGPPLDLLASSGTRGFFLGRPLGRTSVSLLQVMGDLNAKVESEREGFEDVLRFASQTWGGAQEVIMKGLYEEVTQLISVPMRDNIAMTPTCTQQAQNLEPTARERSTRMDVNLKPE